MKARNRTRVAEAEEIAHANAIAEIDINQLELAVINRALRGEQSGLERRANIGKNRRILHIQRANLIELLKMNKKKYDERILERELQAVLAGKKVLSFICMALLGHDQAA